MSGNNIGMVQILSTAIESDQDNHRGASRRQSSIAREIYGRNQPVLDHEEKKDMDSSVDAVFQIREQIDAREVVSSNSQPSVETQHSAGNSLTEKRTDRLPESTDHTPVNLRKWLVLMSSFFNMLIIGGFPFNMSVLYVEFLNAFGKSKAETSLVQSVCTGVYFIGGLVTGWLVTKFGTKICGCCGAVLSATGIALCFIAPNLEFLIIFVGVVSGAGFSLNVICATTSVSQNFSPKESALALAFVSVGSGIGAVCFPLLLQYFVDNFGWRGCLLVISGIVLNQLACSLMSGPDVKRPIASKKDIGTKDSNTTLCRLKAILKDKAFLGFCFALSLAMAAINGFMVYFVDFFEQKGFDRTSVLWLYSGMNTISTIFRIIPGLLAQSPKIPKLAIPAIYAFLGCISLSLLPFITTYSLSAVVLALLGIALGGSVTAIFMTTQELVVKEAYPTGLGIVLGVSGIANIVGAPIAGYFRDISGSYTYSVLSGAGAALLASSIFTWAMIYRRRNGEDPQSRFNMEIDVQSRRRSGFLFRRKSVDLRSAI